MPVTVGLHNVGSYQVSGWPYLKQVELTSEEQEFKFNFVTSQITIWNAGGEDLKFYFSSGANSVFVLPQGKKVTLNIKTGSIFALSDAGTTLKLFASMTIVPLERIGVIPNSSPAGPMPDDDGDGTPDEADPLPKFFGQPPPESSEWDKKGSEDLWMEISGSTEFELEPLTLFLNDTWDVSTYPVLYPGLEAYYLNVDDEIIDYTVNIISPTVASFNTVDTSVAGTYTITYEVTKEFNTISVDRDVIVIGAPLEPEPIMTYQMDGGDFSTLEFEGPTLISDLSLEQEGLEVNEYEEVEE